MASQFEMVAMFIDNDRDFMEIDEYGFGDLLKRILRECHDHNNPKYDATWLADIVVAHIIGYVTANVTFAGWPEEEGSGLHTAAEWATLDAGEPEEAETK